MCKNRKTETLIIVPTYNEKDNIAELYLNIKKYSCDKHILFVDDNSRDGSQEEIVAIAKRDENVHILERDKKGGLASAYLDGFSWGLARNYDWFQQMDADLSHAPRYLPLFDSFKEKYDLIIASRYIINGRSDWRFFRKWISSFGCYYLKMILGSYINDWTGGYNCYKRCVLEEIDFSYVLSQGFFFLSELKYSSIKNGFKIVEFPYIFRGRKKGYSKMSGKIFLEGLLKPWVIKYRY